MGYYSSHLWQRVDDYVRQGFLNEKKIPDSLTCSYREWFKNKGIDVKTIFFIPNYDYYIVTDIKDIQYYFYYKTSEIVALTCPSCGKSHNFSNLNWKGQCENTINKINNNIKKLHKERFNK